MRDAWILVITCDRDSRVVKCKSYEAAYDYMKAELKAEVMAYDDLSDEEFEYTVKDFCKKYGYCTWQLEKNVANSPSQN